jgi:hypothetical protein
MCSFGTLFCFPIHQDLLRTITMLLILHKILIITTIISFILSPVPFAHAEGPVPLGGQCEHTDECGINTGCRDSELGDFKVCKISVPNQSGCAIPQKENLCADNMVCKNNKCKLTFGIKQLEETSPTHATSTVPSRLIGSLGLISRTNFSHTVFIDTVVKVGTFALALAFLTGLTLIFRGGLMYRTAIGHVPLQNKGIAEVGIGASLAILSILLWILFG